MSIKIDPNAAGAAVDTVNFKKTEARKTEVEKVSYRDAEGRAFNLSIKVEKNAASAVYDRKSFLKQGVTKESGKEAVSDGGDITSRVSIPANDPTLEKAVAEFRDSLINQLLKKTFNMDSGETAGVRVPDTVQAATLVEGGQTVTVEMDVVDTDYWSVENTAQRLVDFAVSLYGGGDRGEHLAKMTDGMEQGFEAAKEAFGGTLPDISRQTVDLARKMLAEWAEGGQSGTSA